MTDFSEFSRLEADLRGAGLRALPKIADALNETGKDIRDDARQFAAGARGGMARHYPRSITHEVTRGGLTVEVGPEKGGQGSLGHIFEYGTSRTGPQAHLGPALDRHAPDALRRLADAAGDATLP